jgi:hypothetical protein
MSAVAAFAAGAGLMLALLAAALGLLLRPLAAVLAELCGTEQRAALWTTLSGLALALGGLLAGLLGFLARAPAGAWLPIAGPAAAPPLFRSGAGMFQGTLAGLLFGLAVIAAIVLHFSARMARGIMPPPPREYAAEVP